MESPLPSMHRARCSISTNCATAVAVVPLALPSAYRSRTSLLKRDPAPAVTVSLSGCQPTPQGKVLRGLLLDDTVQSANDILDRHVAFLLHDRIGGSRQPNSVAGARAHYSDHNGSATVGRDLRVHESFIDPGRHMSRVDGRHVQPIRQIVEGTIPITQHRGDQ